MLLCQVVGAGPGSEPHPQADQHVIEQGRKLVHQVNATGILTDCDRYDGQHSYKYTFSSSSPPLLGY